MTMQSEDKITDFLWGMTFGVSLFCLIIYSFGGAHFQVIKQMQSEAIQAGVGKYVATTNGEVNFIWITNK